MKKIIRAEELPQGEIVYLKKDMFGWRTVEPVTNPETGKVIWRNFFNPRGFVMLAILLLLLGIGYLAFKEQLINYHEVISNPCAFCKDCTSFAEQLNSGKISLPPLPPH